MSNKLYDKLRWLVLIFIPAAIAFVLGLDPIWGIPYAQQIAGTLGLTAVFLGSLIKISSAKYFNSESPPYDGELVVTNSGEKLLYDIQVNDDHVLDDIPSKNVFMLKVVNKT